MAGKPLVLHWPLQSSDAVSSHLCFATLHWLCSHPAVTGMQEACVRWSRLEDPLSYVRFVRLHSFHSLHMCKIIMDYSFTERVPKSMVFYSIALFWNVSPLLFFCIFIVMYTCCKAGEEKRAGSHEKYLNNYLSKGFFPQCLHLGSILCSHAQSIAPKYKLETRCWRWGGTRQEQSVYLPCLKGVSGEAKLKCTNHKPTYKQLYN